MTHFEINLQTAARHGYAFAVIARADYLGCGSNVQIIISKHKTQQAAAKSAKRCPNSQIVNLACGQ